MRARQEANETSQLEDKEVPVPPDMTADVEREEQFAILTAERDELQQQLLRTIADMQNMRKRYQQEALQSRQFATEEMVRELLPILDNFERTITAGDQGAELSTVMEGIRAVDRQLRNALERQKVTRILAQGNAFDPDIHEAIATEDTDEHPEGTVTAELEPGYRMGDKVIRPARVKVSKKP